MKKVLLYISCLLTSGLFGQSFEVEKTAISSNYNEYCAGLINSSVIFSSNKKSEVFVTHFDENDEYYSNLYVVEEKEGKLTSEDFIFSSEITSALNEGSLCFTPDEKTVWYTSNILEENKKIRFNSEFKLGIFKAEKRDGIWVKTDEFPYNSKDQSYNTAHPTISPDGKMMIFASDRTGCIGATDLWMCRLVNNEWSAPECLPEGINTSNSELFPFIDENNMLFFSSNGFKEASDLDIFKVKISNLNSPTPQKLAEPINSEFDDYGFIPKQGGEQGYFSSDRDSSDDIFSFKYNYPEFIDCQENYDPSLCYIIEESNMTYIDTLPLAYIWDLGDGTKKRGFTIEHCFPDSGVYDISLNIIDTITGVTFASVNDLELVIELPNQPYITSPDTLIAGEENLFSSKESEFDFKPIEEWFWEMGNGDMLKGDEIYYAFEKPGIFYITLGALSEPDESGHQDKICTYKQVLVVNDKEELEELRIEAEEILEEEIVLDYDYMLETEVDSEEIEEAMSEEKIESTYFVDVLEIDEKVSLDDEYFERLKYEITERFDEEDSLFIYSVGQAENVFALWDIYQEVLDSGYFSAIVKQERLHKFKNQIESVGLNSVAEKSLSNEEVEEEWNRTITQFANIQFESNSSRISDLSVKSLDYIAVMMEIEEDFQLQIHAYTDDKGNADYNLSLSERRADAVKRYLIRKGVPAERLSSQGFGEENPISDNLTELGRAFNRRVEFKILY